jgi:hypothetical protein
MSCGPNWNWAPTNENRQGLISRPDSLSWAPMCAKKTPAILTVLLILAPLFGEDRLYDSFRNPPAEARPFVRWWWNGNRVNEKEILRQLEVMKAAGIGGVEINTVGMLREVTPEMVQGFPELDWLSPEWNRLIRKTTDGARERGMMADLIVGSGWPFGGAFLEPAEQTQRISLIKQPLTGPGRFEGNVKTLAGKRRRGGEEVKTEPKIAFLRLVPSSVSKFQPGLDLSETAVTDGKIRFDIPAGEFNLYCGVWEQGFTHVKLGAPGADGPVVDHFNQRAVRKYLDHLSSRLSPYLEGKLGNGLRAMFVDSLELDHANWTSDFPAEFARRRGYELSPYLPFILDSQTDYGETEFADVVRRTRFDFCKTLVELFHERFLKTYVEWCRSNGVKSRIQAYGRETHPLNGSMLVDLPEGESWLWGEEDRVVPSPTVVNKYVSSAAHLSGKSSVSFEAMTNAVPVFRETLEDFKLCFDMSLMSGVIHPVIHGFNYTPPEAGFPGWVRFGCYLNEKNTWWPYFKLWADYASRLSAVLLQTEAQASVAILGPRADEWSRHFLLYQPFPEVAWPWYHYHLWQSLSQLGISSDFVSEEVLQAASFQGGLLRYGKRAYEALLVQDVESMEPATARSIRAFAENGGKVVFVGERPFRCTGFQDVAARDQEVRETIDKLLQDHREKTWQVPAPNPSQAFKKDYVRMGLDREESTRLLDWTRNLVQTTGLRSSVVLSPANASVLQIHHRDGNRDLVLLANTSRQERAEFEATFAFGNRSVWHWNAQTGGRALWRAPALNPSLPVVLEPAESLLLVLEPPSALPADTRTAGEGRNGSAKSQELEITSPWQVDFRHVKAQNSFSRPEMRPSDLSKAIHDPALATFAGTAVYRTRFDSPAGGPALLDLGKTHDVSEVWLNGKPLGVRWWGKHVYETGDALREGSNQLEVHVTTMLGNYLKSLADINPVAKRWAFWFPPIPAGLEGPVRLVLREANE